MWVTEPAWTLTQWLLPLSSSLTNWWNLDIPENTSATYLCILLACVQFLVHIKRSSLFTRWHESQVPDTFIHIWEVICFRGTFLSSPCNNEDHLTIQMNENQRPRVVWQNVRYLPPHFFENLQSISDDSQIFPKHSSYIVGVLLKMLE